MIETTNRNRQMKEKSREGGRRTEGMEMVNASPSIGFHDKGCREGRKEGGKEKK